MSSSHDFFRYENHTLTCEKILLKDIAQKVGTPVYVYSKQGFLSNLEQLQNGLKGLDYQICFAMKSNSNLSILRLLTEAGAGMDVVSGGELFRALKANVPHNKIVFSGIGKSIQEIEAGLSYQGKGIYSFNIESIPELFVLNKAASEKNIIAPIALRFNPDVDAKTHPYISTGIKKNKFGLDRKEILKIISQLKKFPYLKLRGLSIHIGSQLLSLSPLCDAFKRLITLIDEINYPLEFLDLGGGLGVSYNYEKTIPVPDYCALIHKMFGKQSKFKGKIKIILEPGRQISANSGILLTKILYRKERRSQDFLIIDAAMSELIRPSLYGSYHEIIPIEENFRHDKTKKTTIVGSVCESADFLGKDRNLSVKLNTGDLLAVLSAGAYGFSMSSQYNSRPLIAEVLIDKKNFDVIRKRQTYHNLIAEEIE